jgi:HSP20 family molecular chaperone IbpA
VHPTTLDTLRGLHHHSGVLVPGIAARARATGLLAPALETTEMMVRPLVYDILMTLPGRDPEDITVDVGNEVLTVRGSTREWVDPRHEEKWDGARAPDASPQWTRCRFVRSIALPPDGDVDDLEVGFFEGHLRIVIPRRSGRGAPVAPSGVPSVAP